MSDQFLTLQSLLEQANFEVYAFDMGRSVVSIDPKFWTEFEHGNAAWPAPVQRNAHFALLGVDSSKEHSIAWFFKLPLDERAHLNLGARDQLIETIIQRASDNAEALKKGESADLRSAGAELIQSITPTTEKQARFHALARKALKLPPTEHFNRAIELIDNHSQDSWAELPLQGLAELATRHEEQGNTQRLATLVEQLDDESLTHLSALIDGEPIRPLLAKHLQLRIEKHLHSDTNNTQPLQIAQALSSADETISLETARAIINSSQGVSADGISIISGRFWRALQQPELALQFLENIVMLDEGRSFPSAVQQLLYLTEIRPFVLAALNDPNRSDALAEAVNSLLQRSS